MQTSLHADLAQARSATSESTDAYVLTAANEIHGCQVKGV
jgi:hypothetical protein